MSDGSKTSTILIVRLIVKRLWGVRHRSNFLSFAFEDARSRGDGYLHLCQLWSAAALDQTQWPSTSRTKSLASEERSTSPAAGSSGQVCRKTDICLWHLLAKAWLLSCSANGCTWGTAPKNQIQEKFQCNPSSQLQPEQPTQIPRQSRP